MKLTGALGDFDRTRPLLDGRVPIAGFEVEWQTGELEAIFSRAFEHAVERRLSPIMIEVS